MLANLAEFITLQPKVPVEKDTNINELVYSTELLKGIGYCKDQQAVSNDRTKIMGCWLKFSWRQENTQFLLHPVQPSFPTLPHQKEEIFILCMAPWPWQWLCFSASQLQALPGSGNTSPSFLGLCVVIAPQPSS